MGPHLVPVYRVIATVAGKADLLANLDAAIGGQYHLGAAGELQVGGVGEFTDVIHPSVADGGRGVDFLQPVAASFVCAGTPTATDHGDHPQCDGPAGPEGKLKRTPAAKPAIA